MGIAKNKLQKRREMINTILELFNSSSMVNVIHYSCESFYGLEGKSPRITSIAVRNLKSGQTTSFAIHQLAERHTIEFEQIHNSYDALEKEMLKEFYEFVERHTNYKWLHWNMRDTNYGFPAIAHRYAVLGGKPIPIDENRLFDMATLLIDRYGPGYAKHPRLEKLMEINSISRKDALTGAEEAQAFEDKEYLKLHRSTLRKVDVISNIANRQLYGTLKTLSVCKDEYGVTILGVVEAFTETTSFKILGIASMFITLIAFILQIFG